MKILKGPIFIGGAGRSGTTLLRVILDSHPNICCGPELKVTPVLAETWGTFQGFHTSLAQYDISQQDINTIFRQMFQMLTARMLQKSGKVRIAEKTPFNSRVFLHLFYIFPDSPLIHMIRDPRAVVASLLKMDWVDPATHKPLSYTRSVTEAAKYWVTEVSAGRQILQEPEASRNYIEFHYEKLVSEPEQLVRDLCNRIDEPFTPSLLNYHKIPRNLADESSASQVSQPIYKKALNRWESELSADQIGVIEEIAWPMAGELGYVKTKK